MDVISVLIVDDELPIREELRLFDWENNGAKLIGEAENGEEALQFCKEYTPNVIITDIVMPVMGGIELIDNIRKVYPQIQFIILTCYSDFNYAKEALRLGALDYLMKVTLDDDELSESLEKAKYEIECEQSYQIAEAEQRRLQRSRLFYQAVKLHSNQWSAFYKQLSIEGHQLTFPFRLVRIFVQAQSRGKLLISQEIQRSLIKLEKDTSISFLWFPYQICDYCLLFFDEPDDVKLICKRLHIVVSEINSTLERQLPYIYGDCRIYGVVSNSIVEEEDFADTVRQTDLWADVGFYDEKTLVFVGQPPSFTYLDQPKQKEIDEKMYKVGWDRQGLITFLSEDFVIWANNYRIFPEDLKRLVTRWRKEWQQNWNFNEDYTGEIKRLKDVTTLSQMVELLKSDLENGGGEKCRKEIRFAKKFIREKFGETLSLQMVADWVNLSPYYLSRLFHKEVGESFNKFVKNVRIEKAIEFLQNSDLKVYEIADKVGIPNYRYFVSLFRKETGLTPSAFRKGVNNK
ncbi:response regulator transcription factor [Pullulanibacillus pueri]|nr:response regulator [Pullulanibacillus pueri]